jgi:hypothetical protein
MRHYITKPSTVGPASDLAQPMGCGDDVLAVFNRFVDQGYEDLAGTSTFPCIKEIMPH